MREKMPLIAAGAVTGLCAVALVLLGNPSNMGFCIACFLRDIAGGLGLHRAAAVQYLRPEIIGLILGAFITSLFAKEFKVSGGAGPLLRFLLGMLMMSGALIFLGCPLRMILRLAGGDLNALIALPGYVADVWIGVLFLKKGYTLGRSQEQPAVNGYAAPFMALALLVLVIAAPAFIFFSTEGPGSMHAPLAAALGAGLLVGILAQRSRLCTMGAIRDLILFKESHLFIGIASIFIVALIGNLIAGKFVPGFTGQPIAHTDALWNFLGMAVVGWAAVLAGGCPLRQLILAGEGHGDALLTVLGMVTGAAMMHNFGLAASADGVPAAGKWSLLLSITLLAIIGISNIYRTAAGRNEKAAGSR